jgi:hypothetical protein
MALKKITGNETPRPLRGKTNKFNRAVRFVDLTESLKEIEENFIQLPANPNNGDALVFNGTDWVPGSVGGDSEYIETIVDISSAQILAMGTSPIELLPAPGVDSYYEGKIIFEIDPDPGFIPLADSNIWITYGSFNNTSVGNILSSLSRVLNKISVKTLSGLSPDFTKRTLVMPLQDFTYVNLPESQVFNNIGTNLSNNAVRMRLLGTSYEASGFEEGSGGTLRVKIYHKTITFGA